MSEKDNTILIDHVAILYHLDLENIIAMPVTKTMGPDPNKGRLQTFLPLFETKTVHETQGLQLQYATVYKICEDSLNTEPQTPNPKPQT